MDGLNSNHSDHTSSIHEAKNRYPTVRQAISSLRQLGRPPQKLDSWHYEDKVVAALDALGILADAIPLRHTPVSPGSRENMELIKTNWNRWISPWMQKFLKLAEEEPFDPLYPLIDKALFVIPKLASYPSRCADDLKAVETVELLNMPPYLFLSVMKVWHKILGAMHLAWASWVELLRSLMNDPRGPTILANTIRQQPEEELKAFVGCTIQLFHLLSRRFRSFEVTPGDFIGVHMTLVIMNIYFTGRDRSPLYPPFLASGGVKALVKLLDSLVSKRAIVFVPTTGTKINDDLGVLDALLTFLETTSNGVPGWMDALDAGLLVIMFNTGRLYPPASPEDESQPTTLGRLWHHYNSILQFLSLHMVYPDVLRPFLKAMRRIVSDERLEKRMKNNRSFWRTWKECKRKAKVLRILKDSLKDPTGLGSTVCSYLFCPLKKGDSPPEAPEGFSRFLRCTGCHSAIYCSRTCQRKDWRACHKSRCNELARALKDGRPMISDRDRAFFMHLITYYVLKHGRDILEELSEFTPPTPWDPSAGNDDDKLELGLKRSAHNTGVVVLDFCNVDELDIHSLDCLSVRHIDDVIKDERISGHAERLEGEHRWIAGDTEMHVLAFFPATIGGGDFVCPVSEVYNLPQLSESDFDDDEGWTTDDSFEDDSEDDL